MLKELKKNEFKRVSSIFSWFDHCLALRAAIEGNNPGRIFVDDVDTPHTALALTVGGYFLAGDSNKKINDNLSSFLQSTSSQVKHTLEAIKPCF
jgi:hypothetical protein